MVQPVWGAPAPNEAYQSPVAKPVHTQATSFATPFQNTTLRGWWQPLSVAAPVAKVQLGNSFVPFNKVQIAHSPLNFFQPLADAPPVVRAQQGYAFVPFNTKQIASSPLNFFQPLSAPVFTAVVNSSASTFVVPSFVVPSGWQSQLSSAVLTAQAQVGNSFVPLNPTQVAATPPPNGWFGPINFAVNTAIAQPTQATTFAIPAQVSNSVSQFGWYYPLSQAVPVSQAQQGYSFVPFNTAQMLPAIIPLFYDAGIPRTATVYYQALFNPLLPIVQLPNTVIQVAWQQPLSVAAPTTPIAAQGMSFVPLDTAQFVPPPDLLTHYLPFLVTIGKLKSF